MRIDKVWPIQEIDQKDQQYPECLKQLGDVPDKLYFRGNWDISMFDNVMAIVGSRRMSQYGKRVIELLMPNLIFNKINIISGFMYGVDYEAHRNCVELGGKTIAVLGWGLNYFQSCDMRLYEKILDNGGLIISEFKADFKPTLWSFPQRNRIVAMLANKGVIVVEAGVKSGSLITARLAAKFNKKVWAVPGPISSAVSAGTNYLIKNNLAEMVYDPEDICKSSSEQICLFKDLSDIEQKIVKLLEVESLPVDQIAKKLKTDVATISVEISMMSIEGLISDNLGLISLIRSK